MKEVNKKLRDKILKMFQNDQKLRILAINDSKNKKLSYKVYECDQKNLPIIKNIVEDFGWPTFDLVGKKASNSFWILVQHADSDLHFQKKCLILLTKAARNNQAKPSNVAYLTDRIRAAEGKKIKFGTQYTIKNGQPVIKPVINRKKLVELRKKYSMESLEKQTRRIKREYAKLFRANQ